MSKNSNLELFRRGVPQEMVFIFLVVFSVFLLVVDTKTTWLDAVRQTLSFSLYPAQKAVLSPRDVVMWGQGVINAADLIQNENEALQRRRIELAQVSSTAAQLSTENAQLRRLLGMQNDKNERPAVVAEILYEAPTPFNRRLIFDRGELDGVAPGMPVIDEGGVVGQIVRVTPMSSEAALLTDEVVSIPVQLARTGLRLIAFGSNQTGKIEVRYFASDADIKPGDLLFTSGIGGAYPPGLTVGRVDTVDRDATSGFARAIVTPASHPDRYRHFLILRNVPSTVQNVTPSELKPDAVPSTAPKTDTPLTNTGEARARRTN
jgi:rod shape-determining protein MreC